VDWRQIEGTPFWLSAIQTSLNESLRLIAWLLIRLFSSIRYYLIANASIAPINNQILFKLAMS
jgi:hypothetical protein